MPFDFDIQNGVYGYLVPSTEEGGADTFTPFKATMYEKIYANHFSYDGVTTYTYTANQPMTVIVVAYSNCCGGAGWNPNTNSAYTHYAYCNVESSGTTLQTILEYAYGDGFAVLAQTKNYVLQLNTGDYVKFTHNAYNYGKGLWLIMRIA